MGIRIDITADGPESVVHIAGRLSSKAVAELEKVCDSMESHFVIDISNLLFVDEEGINALRRIADKRSQVQGASPFVRLLLDNAPEWPTEKEF